jgi:hypothetical protein
LHCCFGAPTSLACLSGSIGDPTLLLLGCAAKANCIDRLVDLLV